MGIVGGGGQAELCLIHSSHLLKVPSSVSDVHAGGFAEAFITAHDALVTRGGLTSGSRLLVTGAAGGVGTAAVQIGVSLGAEVIASVRDTSRHDLVKDLGASLVISPEEAVAYGPYDVILELVGAASLGSGVLDALNVGASVVVIGVGGGSRLEVDLLKLMNARASIGGATLRSRSVLEKASATEAVARDLLDLFSNSILSVPILETYAFTDAAEAYDRFAEGSKFGKIVLTFT
jgi:NADPH:quinone reductase-like Zn-dependent oxidoreductase